MNKEISLQLTNFLSGEQHAEMIPLLSPEEEAEMNNESIPDVLPILTLRNSVLFPGMVIPITVGRKKSIQLVKDAYEDKGELLVTAQKNPKNEDPNFEDIYKIGTAAKIIKLLTLPDGNTTVIIQGKRRAQINELKSSAPYMTASVTPLIESFPEVKDKDAKPLIQSLKDLAGKIINLSPELPQEAKFAIDNIETPGFLTHFLASNLNVDNKIKQEILEVDEGVKRINFLMQEMMKEVQMLEIKKDIQSKVHVDIDQQQKDYFLRQQIKIIQDELGEETPEKDLEHIQKRAKDKKWSEEVKLHFLKELSKLKRMNPSAADYSVSLNYIETLVDLPWNEVSKDNFDLKRAPIFFMRTAVDFEFARNDHHIGLLACRRRILKTFISSMWPVCPSCHPIHPINE